MPRGKKFSRSRKEPISKPKRKGKFNYRTASYIKEREAKNEEIENRRQKVEEYKARQQSYYAQDSSEEEEEEDPVNDLLKTFKGQNVVKKVAVVSESESEEEIEENSAEDAVEEQELNEEQVDNEDSGEENDEVDVEKEDEDVDIEECAEDEDESESEGSGESESENKNLKNETKSKKKKVQKEDEIEVEIKEKDEEDEETAREDAGHVKDPFTIHLRNDLDNELYQALSNLPVSLSTQKLKWPNLGNVICQIPQVDKVKESAMKKQKVSVLEDKTFAEHGKVPTLINNVDWNELYVKSLIQGNLTKANYNNIKDDLETNPSPLTPLQKELLSVINNYQDLLYCERTFDNEAEIQFTYCLHAINHVLKTRTKVLHHNAKIQKSKLTDMSEIPDEYRDQGLLRPKVLILVPFRYSCLKIVELLISIFIGEEKGGSVINKKRFMEDFGGSEIIMPKKNPKPEDYEQTFKGNTDDTFKIGISITKKALKLYSDFYSSDIIISSVLGMRMTIGAEGEEDRDYDFLASVELLIMDQMEIFFMQNWDHLLHVMNHLHLQPKNSHGTDFGRVRSWCVNGWSKYYRQTLIFSGIQLPEIHGIFNKHCHNYSGKVKIANPISTGSITHVLVQIPQVFHRFNVNDHAKAIDARFEFFTTKILPQYRDSIMNHTLIFVPSYFDYVKLRNYFRKEDISFVQICEYTRDAKVARARDMFFHSDANFLLYTERFHFFRRIRVKGIRHIIFYAPPAFSHFYSEMCNLMQEAYQNPKSGSSSNMTVTTVYCKYDVLPLSAIVGSDRAGKMVSSEKTVHMVMTG
ncbi:digestive organ expansion factor homolog [Nasonia vitripennis]|uniref:Digestive organ expansion factor homolog n=1 Tax=Nasonia vitripennis TaxID=7425 RepID=A0A7M7G483_NASVI|nr:digestive organ expansion factor homolog [Nasonia vitripennis]